MLSTRRDARRRASLLLAGAVALSGAGCTLVAGDEAPPAASPVVPLTTTTTTEPPSPTFTSQGGPAATAPDPTTVVNAARNHMDTSANVTISGTLFDADRDLLVKIRAEGSTGGLKSGQKDAGISRTTASLADGGTLEAIIIGWDHFAKVDRKWLDGVKAPRDSPLRKHADQWVKVPRDNSPLDRYRPYQLLKQNFFGQGLTQFDARRSTVSIDSELVPGQDVYRVALNKAGKGGQSTQRILWVAAAPQPPEPLQLTYGRYPTRTTLVYSDWNNSSEDFSEPRDFTVVEDISDDDL